MKDQGQSARKGYPEAVSACKGLAESRNRQPDSTKLLALLHKQKRDSLTPEPLNIPLHSVSTVDLYGFTRIARQRPSNMVVELAWSP